MYFNCGKSFPLARRKDLGHQEFVAHHKSDLSTARVEVLWKQVVCCLSVLAVNL